MTKIKERMRFPLAFLEQHIILPSVEPSMYLLGMVGSYSILVQLKFSLVLQLPRSI